MQVVTQRSKFHISCEIRLDEIYGAPFPIDVSVVCPSEDKESWIKHGLEVLCDDGAWSLVEGGCWIMYADGLVDVSYGPLEQRVIGRIKRCIRDCGVVPQSRGEVV